MTPTMLALINTEIRAIYLAKILK